MAMHQVLTSLLLWLVAIESVVQPKATTTAPPRLALIISISKFQHILPISTADDGRKMAYLLRKQGFIVDTVSDEEATVAGIQEAFRQLIQRVRNQPGAVVVVYISSHGTSLQNENSREDPEPDGRDEAIICFDTYDQKNTQQLIVDDQVGKWFDEIRDEIGSNGHLVYFLDACFSNSGIRGDIRQAIKSVGSNQSAGDFDLSASQPVGSRSAARPGRGKLVAYFAADAGKTALILPENNMSAMTLGLYNSLLTMKPDRNYWDLFHLLQLKTNDAVRKAFRNEVPSNPIFIMGSPGVGNEKLFNGYFAPMAALLIEPQRFGSQRESVKVPRSVYGTTKGSLYAFRRNETIVAQGVVREQDDYYDYVSLLPTKTGSTLEPLASLTAEVQEFNYQSMETTVGLVLTDLTLRRALENRLKQAGPGLLTLATPARPAQVLVRQTGNHIQLQYTQDESPAAPPVERQSSVADVAEQLDQQLRNIAFYRLLTQLEPEQHQSRVKLALHRATIQRLYQGKPIDKRDRTHAGQDYTQILHIDDTLAFRRHKGLAVVDTSQQAVLNLQNTTADSLYFNLLDVDPVKNVTLLWPSPEDRRMDDPAFFLLKPHETKSIPLADFNPPFGLEEFRLITSHRPIDLRDFLENQRQQGRKGLGNASLLGSTTVFRYYILPSKQ
ncbi:MAG: caspase family protein [Bacteroidetes bacterium]|nr:caspase family protein [Fibrella sp.]